MKTVITLCAAKETIDEFVTHLPEGTLYVAQSIDEEDLTNPKVWERIGISTGIAMRRGFDHDRE